MKAEKKMKTYCKALTIAGSDSGGGAGIQADLKTFSALSCYGMSVITALTAQNTVAVTGIQSVPPDFIGLQIHTVLSDIGADAVKIGMLHSPQVIKAVADSLKEFSLPAIVLDPVMVAKSGDTLLRDDAVAALKSCLIPMATLVTPNLPEASVLLGRTVNSVRQMGDACQELAELGCGAVLLKGGHLEGKDCVDMLFESRSGTLTELTGSRIDTVNSHGTGCTVSSAITAYLARGMVLEDAVHNAKKYITEALTASSGIATGKGHGPVHHFHRWWQP